MTRAKKPVVDGPLTSDVREGVTVSWLAGVFGLQLTDVRRKLGGVNPIGTTKNGKGALYDLQEAASYLVKPRGGIEAAIRAMKPTDLPVRLQDGYWSALLKQQKWEAEAKQLWRSEDVVSAFGQVFQTIKFAIQLWPDQVERATDLSEEQREMLVEMADGLQTELHRVILELAKELTDQSNYERMVEEMDRSFEEDDEDEDLI